MRTDFANLSMDDQRLLNEFIMRSPGQIVGMPLSLLLAKLRGRKPTLTLHRPRPVERTPEYMTACDHEAGHATLAAFFDMPITTAWADAYGNGAVEYVGGWDNVPVWHQAVTLAGGAVSQWLFLDDDDREEADMLAFAGPCANERRGQHKSDYEQLGELLPAIRNEVFPNSRDPFIGLQMASIAARDLLESNWQSVLAVRDALRERGRLTGAEVRVAAGLSD